MFRQDCILLRQRSAVSVCYRLGICRVANYIVLIESLLFLTS